MSALSENEFHSLRQVVLTFLSQADVSEMAPVAGGFSHARVFRVRTERGDFALRCSPDQAEPLARTFERARFLEHLRQHEIPVAAPLLAQQTGEPFLLRDSGVWQLEPWQPGLPCSVNQLAGDRIIRVMQRLAEKHAIAARYSPTPAGQDWFECRRGPCPAVQDRMRIIESFSNSDLVEMQQSLATAPRGFRQLAGRILTNYRQAAAGVYEELQRWEWVEFSLIPCWRDLWSEHVLMTEGEVTGWIDAVACRTDHPGTDLSRLLGSLFDDDLTKWEAALDAYARFAVLTNEDRRLIRTLDRSSVLLSGMNWICRHQLGMSDPAKLPAIECRLERIAMRLERLVGTH